MTKYLLIVNPNGGRARRSNELQSLLHAAAQNPALQVHLLKPADTILHIVRRAIAQGVEAVGAAGGDGTINSVASALVDTAIPLVVIPFGTLNHFARDIGVPNDFEAALRLFAEGSDQTIDVGEVNGFYFLNNSSVGLYPSLVNEREKHEKRLGKGVAYLLAGWKVLRQPWLLHIKLKIDGKSEDLKTSIIFFANNQINTEPLLVGQRPRLDGQILDAFIVKASSQWQLFRVAASFLRNKLDESPLVARSAIAEAIVYTKRRHIRVACDGEIHRLQAPLKYSLRVAALVVRVPPEKIAAENEKSECSEESKNTDSSLRSHLCGA